MDGRIPSDAAICCVKHVVQASAQILLDDDPTRSCREVRFANFQVFNNFFIRKMTQTPLRPYQIILGAINGLPILKADVEDVSHAFCSLERLSKPCNRLHHVNFFGD